MGEAARSLEQTGLRAREGKYLTFVLAQEEFGLEILKVREIIGMLEITAIPQTPEYVKGVINLRGRVIPVIDLRLKFGLPPLEYGERTCIIVVDVNSGQGLMQMGVVVDAVSEVLNVGAEDLEPPPNFGRGLNNSYILGIAKTKGSIKILLDIDRVLSAAELLGLEALGS
ncbi:MAG: chemotaxis protein CheW [Syntrophobacterales bacterium]|nr:chemotaxis protein CheW [Syntrophobacterales bacterium]